MIASSPSPSLQASAHSSPTSPFSAPRHYDGSNKQTLARSQASHSSGRATPLRANASPRPTTSTPPPGSTAILLPSLRTVAVAGTPVIHNYVDAATQWSPPKTAASPPFPWDGNNPQGMQPDTPLPLTAPRSPSLLPRSPSMATKRTSSSTSLSGTPSQGPTSQPTTLQTSTLTSEGSSPKRSRPETAPRKIMPLRYETCSVKDLVILISSMLMELIRFNDTIPLKDGRLTRFHSRAPPGISVGDYLQRLATHATLSPPILLSMVYYIDRLCALYPAFTISSLTVHRFLITSATVASKGLSDSFWTNKTYARVGGVSLRELALLELEFLWRVEWKIVPQPEALVDYYMSLVARSDGYVLEKPPREASG